MRYAMLLLLFLSLDGSSSAVPYVNEFDDKDRLSALGKSWAYASGEDQSVIAEWIADGASGLFPLMLLDGTAFVLPTSEAGTRVLHVQYSADGPQSIHWSEHWARIGSFGVPKAKQAEPPPELPADLAAQVEALPEILDYVIGIGWAYAMLPDLSSVTTGSLREVLHLAVPPPTQAMLEAEFDSLEVYSTGVGDVILRVSDGAQEYHVMVQSFHAGSEPFDKMPGFSREIRVSADDPRRQISKRSVGAYLPIPGYEEHFAISIAGLETPPTFTLIASGWDEL